MENLVNLCLDLFVERIEASSVSRDGHSVENLISMDPQIHSKGFGVEHFIRPPVSIVITFKYPVHIASILLKPKLESECEVRLGISGSHLSDGSADYEYPLHSGCVARGHAELLHLLNRSFDRKWSKGIAISRASVAMVKGSHMDADGLDMYQTVEQPLRHINTLSRLRHLRVTATRLTGIKPFALKWIEVWGTLSASCSGLERDAFQTDVQCVRGHTSVMAGPPLNLYSGHNFHHSTPNASLESACDADRKPWNPFNSQLSQECGPPVSPPSYTNQTSSENTGHPKPLHGDSLDRCPPKLPKREVPFPEANAAYPRTKRLRMKESSLAVDSKKPSTTANPRSITGHQTFDLNFTHVNSGNHTLDGSPQGSTGLSDNSGDIPARLLDAITCEVMQLPMVLPSGYVVDRSTADKLASNDLLYGRPPTDPFTGVPFSELSKPRFSPELKVSLDGFLADRKASRPFSEPSQSVPSSRTVGTASDILSHLEGVKEVKGTYSSPNERAHPVSKDSTSCGQGGLGVPCLQKVPLSEGGCHDNGPGPIDAAPLENSSQGVRGVKDSSFESKVSCSLDVALIQLFSHN